MRRIVPMLLVALVVAAWTTTARGGARSTSCPTGVATSFSAGDRHTLEFEGHGFTLDSFGDGHGHVMKILGNDRWIGVPPPGWNENSVVNGGMLGTQIIFDPGHENAYVARGHTSGSFPVDIRVRRYTPAIQLDGVATWLLMMKPASSFSLAFANGQPLSSLRLCLGSASLRPDAIVDGPAAQDMTAPRIGARLVGGKVVLTATDARPGVGGIWWIAQKAHRGGRYAAPIAVPRDDHLVVWALDKAGNLASASFDVAKL